VETLGAEIGLRPGHQATFEASIMTAWKRPFSSVYVTPAARLANEVATIFPKARAIPVVQPGVH